MSKIKFRYLIKSKSTKQNRLYVNRGQESNGNYFAIAS